MTNKPVNNLKLWLELTKLKIMIPVSLTGFTGYFAFDPVFSSKAFLTSLGILLMAISSSILNEIQEIEADKKMNRTCNRPLPSTKDQDSACNTFFAY